MTKIRAETVHLFLLPEVEERIRHYTELAGGEVSGLGTIEEFDGGFLVDKVFLPKQACTPAGTTLEEDAVATLLLELEAEGDDSGRLRFWWHSHAHHDVFWSQTDEECIEGLANGDYVLSLVTNKRGDTLARLDIYRPTRVTIDQIPVGVRSEDESLREICELELKERVDETPSWGPSLLKVPADLSPHPGLHESITPDVVDEMTFLRDQYMAGHMSYAEYMDYVEEVYHG